MAETVADLREANQMLRATLEGAPEMIAVEDTASRYLAFNRAYHAEFKKVFGVDLKLGASMFEALAHLPQEQRAAAALFERTIRGEDFTVTHEFGDKRLARRLYELHCFPLRDSAGRVIGGTHIARDVTERRRAEEALRASEENYRRMIDSSQDCIKVLDLEGRVLSINPGGRSLMELGEDLSVYLGSSWLDYWQGESRQLAAEALERVRSGGVGRFRAPGTTTQGHLKWWDETLSPMLDASGRVERLLVVAHDITQHKQAEDELRRSEAEFRAFFESSGGGKAQADPVTGRFLRVNDKLCELTGYSKEEMLGMTITDILHPEDRERQLELFRQARDSEAAEYSVERRYRRKDGTTLWVQTTVGFLRDERGRAHRALAIIQDITPLKRIEQDLRASEEKFRALAENARASFGIVQGQRFVYANPWFAQVSGYSVEELLTLDFPALVHPDFKPMMEDRARRRQMGEAIPNHYEFAMLTRSGEKRWVEFSVGTIEYRGKPAIIGTGFDITERKRAEDALRMRNERLALLSDAAAHLLKAENPDTMIRELFEKVSRHLDIQGYMNFMVNEAGDALRLDSYAGIPPEAAQLVRRLEFGQGVCGTVAQCCQPIYAINIQQSEAEMVLLLKGLGIRAYACNPLIARGKLLGTLAFATTTRDAFSEDDLEFLRTISRYVAMAKERLRLENELRRHIEQLASANAALAEADRRKNEFLAMLAHELRNPLAPIRNAMQVLRLVDLHEPVQQRQGDIIDRQITHMARLLNDLLDVSRITRGKIELCRHPLPLADVLAHAVETARPLIETRHQALTVTPPPPALRVLADLDRLAQVVGNLLTNAAKYTEERGRIWLEAAREGNEAVIRVRDTGVGIAPELLPHVFELFTQADHSLAHAQGGLGIGLTMVHSLVEMHGGSVEARSAGLGQGSEFTIHLPALADEGWTEALRPEAPRSAAAAEAPPRRVLVVDDIADTAQSLAELLEIWGHQVRVAYDGSGALEAAQAFKPEVVLLDIGLPDLDGFEVARRLRQKQGGGSLMIVALTGYGQASDQHQSSEAGFNHHLVKPVDLEALRKLL